MISNTETSLIFMKIKKSKETVMHNFEGFLKQESCDHRDGQMTENSSI